MARKIDFQNYESMIGVLQEFIAKISESSETMGDAGQTFADNMEDDDNAQKANAKLGKNLQRYQEVLEKASGLIRDMQEEMEAAAKTKDIISED